MCTSAWSFVCECVLHFNRMTRSDERYSASTAVGACSQEARYQAQPVFLTRGQTKDNFCLNSLLSPRTFSSLLFLFFIIIIISEVQPACFLNRRFVRGPTLQSSPSWDEGFPATDRRTRISPPVLLRSHAAPHHPCFCPIIIMFLIIGHALGLSSKFNPYAACFAKNNRSAGVGADAEAEALRQQVLANEKGFRESSAFNPVRARQAQEEEETRVLAAQWGSTPERAKEIMKTTQADKDMSFQVLLCCHILVFATQGERGFLVDFLCRNAARVGHALPAP